MNIEQQSLALALEKLFETKVAQPPLTRTCKWVRAETMPIFYGANIFQVCLETGLTDEPKKWLRAIGPANRKLLQEVDNVNWTRPGDLYLGEYILWARRFSGIVQN